MAGHSLWGALSEDAARPQEVAAPPVDSGPGGGAAPADRERPWPALFGSFEPAPEGDPPAPMPVPDYVLKGLVTSGAMRWAILAGDGGDQLVQEGDALAGGAEVAAIRQEGVWIAFDGRRTLVAFSDTAPVRTATVELGPEGQDPKSPRRRQDVRTQSLTPAQLRDIILKAEAERIARGMVPPPPEDARATTSTAGASAEARSEDRPMSGALHGEARRNAP